MRHFLLLIITFLLWGCSRVEPFPSEPQDEGQPSPTVVATTTPFQPRPTLTQIEPTPIQRVTALPDPSGFQWTPVLTGLNRPVDLQHAGDDRLFVVGQRGVIWLVEEGELADLPFLDIRGRVSNNREEQGLLGLAFHPDYPNTGTFFVNYTDTNGDTQIASFLVSQDPGRADPDSETVIMRIHQPFANHNGGGLAFGPDGYLYIGTGDGGSAGDPENHGQRLDTLLGKMLRVDVTEDGRDYSIPPDNPFSQVGGLPEIWAYGLRNPWRFDFDSQTNDLYIADVGQNRWEEINFLPADAPAGANFGWNIREGNHAYSGEDADGLIDPVAEYDHDLGCSVTGGVVVRDPSLPEWNGIYLYGDFCSGLIWGLVRDVNGGWQSSMLFQTNTDISSFGEDSQGRVYLVDHRGTILHLERTP